MLLLPLLLLLCRPRPAVAPSWLCCVERALDTIHLGKKRTHIVRVRRSERECQSVRWTQAVRWTGTEEHGPLAPTPSARRQTKCTLTARLASPQAKGKACAAHRCSTRIISLVPSVNPDVVAGASLSASVGAYRDR